LKKKKEFAINSNLYTFTVDSIYSNMSSSEIIKALQLLNSTIPYVMKNQEQLSLILNKLTPQVKSGGRPRKRKTSKNRKTSRKRKIFN
jgi:hypothetical protein